MLGQLKHRGLLLIATCFLGWGCADGSFSIGGPLELSISAVSPVALTDSLVIEYAIIGRSLLGMTVDFSDTQVESLFFLGAQTAGGRVPHLYAAPGQYTVSARVEDSVEGSLTEEITVTINP